jgi:hypothetical protein
MLRRRSEQKDRQTENDPDSALRVMHRRKLQRGNREPSGLLLVTVAVAPGADAASR